MRTAPTQDRNRRPLYQEVKAYVRDRIRRKEWPPHYRVPSENALVGRLGISRMTVNRALRELSREGCLYRVQGVGTFVAAGQPQAAFLGVRSMAEEIQRRGGVHSHDLLRLQEEKAPADMAAEMGIRPGSSVFHAVLLHRDDGVPVQYAERFVNPAIAPDFLRQDFDRITPSAYLLRVALITQAEHVLEAVMPERHIRKQLHMSPDEPGLVLHRTTWVEATVATRSRFVYPGSRFRIGSRFRMTPDDKDLVI